jgi:hypothetical protein
VSDIVDRIENNVKQLNVLFDNSELIVKYSTFRDGNRTTLKKLSNSRVTGTTEWEEFKNTFLDYQKSIGFLWKPYRAPYGPMSLEYVEPPGELGTQVAKELIRQGVPEGNLENVLAERLPQLYSSGAHIDLKKSRRAFSEAEWNNKSYNFKKNGYDFSLRRQAFEFKVSDGQNHEIKLGEVLTNRIKTKLRLDFVAHRQAEHDGGIYENEDLAGFVIEDHFTYEEVITVAFELKSTNKKQDVLTAISQAVNYRSRSHETYLVIPMFSPPHHHSAEDRESLLNQCRSNGLGVISIVFKDDGKSVDYLEVVESPHRRDPQDPALLRKLMELGHREYCPMCRRVVKPDGDQRIGCGWQVVESSSESPSGEAYCMKERLEKMVAGQG